MTINKLRLAGIATAAALIAAPLSSAQVASYSQDFEGLDQTSATALGDDNWVVGANVFAPDGTTFLYNYFTFPAPNGGPAFSGIDVGQGGPDQGAQQLVVYNDYNNADHNIGNVIEANVFQEAAITAADTGVWVLQFDAKLGNLAGTSTADAFVKTIDPGAGFAVTSEATVDTTGLPTTWGTFQITVNINAGQVGQLLQFGFRNRAANFEASGIFYDNVSFDRVQGIDSSYSQNFEALVQTDPAALGDEGWVVGANVFDPTGTTFLYNYFTFPAPNGGPAFSGIDIGQGGPDQGDQQLVVYNDYNNADHNIGNRIEANVFREQVLTATDAGAWVFEFDAKLGNLSGASTADAFIKTIDPNAGFFVTSEATVETTALPTTWGTYQISVNIDASQAGQLLQFGFRNVASNFEDSGVFYDNVEFGRPVLLVDSDGDGVTDDVDNCTTIANPGQQDTNGDGFGNRCDTDLNGDCITNPIDLGIFKSRFFTTDPDADFDSTGIVNALDLGVLKSLFFQQPGPSALAACP